MMTALTFHGGIHPYYGKELTQGAPTEEMKAPQRVVIPLVQHIGAPCEPLVKIGDQVFKGQRLGEAKSPVSAPVHASISGKVTGLGSFPHPSGKEFPAVVIESDGRDVWAEEALADRPDGLSLDPAALREIVRGAGIVGMGGATFPTHVKLQVPAETKIHTLVINGVECEPYLTADHRVMLEQTPELIEGIKILRRIVQAERVVIGIEDNKPDAVARVRAALKGEPDLPAEVKVLKTKYPQGGEKQLIKAALGLEVPSGGLPFQIGIVVQNVGTAVAVYEAVRFGKPLIDRIVTVTGFGIRHPKNLRVRIGTRVRDVLDACEGFHGEPGKVIFGGPMMGMAQHSLDVPIIKGTGGVLVFPRERVAAEPFRPCIRCALCIEACPQGLLPNMLSVAAEGLHFEEAKHYHPFDCIECGCCDYVCPSRRPIVHHIKHVKAELTAKKAQAVKKAS
ncbi:MAG: electron transport complex subunit RsxC [Nitrospirae bacterium]|nr:electron transport complex subunit RsxC [Nitrospirota bacterium]